MADGCMACGDFVSRTTGGSQVFMTMVIPQQYRIPVQVGPGSNFEAREYICPLNNATFKCKKVGKGVEAYDDSGFKAQVVDVSPASAMEFAACGCSMAAREEEPQQVHKGTNFKASNSFLSRLDDPINDQVINGDLYDL